jgi:DNA polymerase III subunit chi
MTRIDFHSNVPDKIGYVCRLVRKVRAAGCKIAILSRDEQQLRALDEALWNFSEHDFLPHVALDDALAAKTPIVLAAATTIEAAEFPHYDVLINLSETMPANFARFTRMLEIVSALKEDHQGGRERYKHYQQRGYPLSHHLVGTA